MSNYPFLKYPKFYNKAIRLSKKERADPIAVLRTFFYGFPLYEVRDILWLMATALVGRKDYVIKYNTEDLLCFYEQIEKMIEAAVIIMKNNKDAPAKP